jgi:hypothetical protein
MIKLPIIYAIILMLIAHTLTWIQLNAQFISPWAKNNQWLVALSGIPIAFLFIKATSYVYDYYDELWPSRIIGFSIGTLIFSMLTYLFMKEGINLKTGICLGLSVIIILIQLLWK